MDLVELALNPLKAAQRFSPFTTELPEMMARKLEYTFGERASAHAGDRAAYARAGSAPASGFDRFVKREPWAVVRPAVRGDLLELVRFANRNGVPIVPRGGGTSVYGSAVPTEGGVIVDMRSFNKVLDVDAAEGTVTVEGGITFADLEARLAADGLALRQAPQAARAATVAGWVATGGSGVGSAKYGPFTKDVLEVTLVQPDGTIVVLDGEDLDLAVEAHGITGFITEVTLRVRNAAALTPFLATFPALAAFARAARRFSREAEAFSIHLYTPDYAELVNDASGVKAGLLPKGGWSILVALEEGGSAAAAEIVRGIVKSGGGTLKADADAEKAWDLRFDAVPFQKLGPSVVVGEAVIPADRVLDAFEAAMATSRFAKQGIAGLAAGPGEFLFTLYGLEDERRATYPPSVGNALAFLAALKENAGGRAASTGVTYLNEAPELLGKSRLKKLKRFRKDTDKREVFHPGPVIGGRSRVMPLPVHDLGLQLSLAGGALKANRGMFPYKGGAKADPYALAVPAAIGRVHAGPLADAAYDALVVAYNVNVDHVAPEREGAILASHLPRGRAAVALALLDGTATPSVDLLKRCARSPLSNAVDAACRSTMPVSRITDLLLGALVDGVGALPEHAALAESAAANGNVLGKPKDGRNKWAALAWAKDARTVFFADDVASYDTTDVALGAAQALMNAGVSLAHLGKADAHSGAALIETGQRDAAKELVLPMLETLAKEGRDEIVTPDANAVRAIRHDWPLFAKGEDVPTPRVTYAPVRLAEYAAAKRLEFEEAWGTKVVFHAPEGLPDEERLAGVAVLEAMGADVVVGALDCGQGRALDKLDAKLHQHVSEACLKDLAASGAATIVTANPSCYTHLKKLAKKAKLEIEVVDLHAVVAQRMKSTGGAAPVAVAVEEEAPAEPEIGPDQCRVEFVKEGVVLAVGKNQSILDAADDADLELPSSCKAGNCDTCSAKWEGTAADQSAGEALTPDQQKTYVLTCIARPTGPIKIWSDERP